jgi:hypothetical protein
MSDVSIEAASKRGPGRPRKQRPPPDEAVNAREPLQGSSVPPATSALPTDDMPPRVSAPPPLTDTDIERVDRKGAAKLLGKSLMTIVWLETNDPDFPAPFTLGKNNFYFLTNDLRAYVLKKAALANAQKKAKMQGAVK